jgi:hypothetical protein
MSRRGHQSRRQLEEQNIFLAWIFGVIVWLLIGFSVWRSYSGAAIKPPSRKEFRKMETVALKIEKLLYQVENRVNLVLKLRKTTEGYPAAWSNSPLDKTLHWLAKYDEEDRLSLQRYAVIILHFFTNQLSNWKECSGPKLPCPFAPVLATSTSECEWFGITCSLDNVVTRIDWSSNNLSTKEGEWPEELLLLQNLELLWLGDNPSLETTLPDKLLPKMSNLQSLSLFRTKLQGSIPMGLYELTELRSLRLYETRLTGTLSSNISKLSRLEWLWLHRNEMTGTIPSDFSRLSNLEGLTGKLCA